MSLDLYYSVPVAKTAIDINLEPFCIEQQNKSITGNLRSMQNGWQSPNIIDKVDPKFSQEILKEANSYFYQIDGKNDTWKLYMDNMWINVTFPGGNNVEHIHPNTFLSGVYYVTTPDSCGRIGFKHPCSFTEYDWKPQYFNHLNKITGPTQYMDTNPHMLYLFPSWLSHYVEPNKSESNRISISFNISIKELDR